MKQISKYIFIACFCIIGLSVFGFALGETQVIGVDPAKPEDPVGIEVKIGNDGIKDSQGIEIGGDNIGMDSLEAIVGRVSGYLFLVGAFLAPMLIIIGGWMYFTSAGDSNRTQSAKKLIYWAVGGLAILLFAKGIVSIFRYILNF